MNKFDVLAVNLKTHQVRIMDTGKSEKNAEAYVNIAVMRRGVEEEFFVACRSGDYEQGEKWAGDKC